MTDTHPFHSPKTHGFVRVAAATPVSHVADPTANAAEHVALIRQAGEQGVDLVVFPELSLSAYAIDDLHMQAALLEEVERQVAVVAQATADADLVAVVGAPIRNGDALYNCAVVIGAGEVLGVVPKTYLPNYREYYEKRWFAPATARSEDVIQLNGETVDFAPGLVFEAVNRPGFVFAVEICEDYWAPLPPSTRAALAGARILLNLSASNIVIGKADERAMLSASHSARTLSAYVFTASGWGESTTDLAWDGQATIHELGAKLAEGERFALENHLTIADVDVDRIGLDRLRNGTFAECARLEGEAATVVPFMARDIPPPSGEGDRPKGGGGGRPRTLASPSAPSTATRSPSPDGGGLIRPLDRFPFVPDDAGRLDQDCYEAFNIQVQGLMRRMTATNGERLVIGVSGGLDSTQALLVACRAFDRLNLPRADILGFTMPGFATSDGTKSNAWALMKALGVTGAEIDIRPAAEQMFKDIGHPYAAGEPVHDITFENVQAGLRTDYLFRLANQNRAFVLGTGDLSELALGWATYGVGDHMSHYNVNGGVAKTLIRHLIRWVAARELVGADATPTLHAILDTEISPELVPARDGAIQSTEGTVGPYALNDFFLFYFSRFGLKPSKVAFLAHQAWGDAGAGEWPANTPEAERVEYDLATIKGWLRKFLIRFFQTAQFKRSALPNGPKVITGGSLSPRGDWRAPSDGSAQVWLDELDANVPD